MTDQDTIIDEVRRLLVGPDPRPNATTLDVTATELRLAKRSPYVSIDGEEILRGQRPSQRYGVGILFHSPAEQESGDPAPEVEDIAEPDESEPDTEEGGPEEVGEPDQTLEAGADEGDEIVPHRSDPGYRPSAIGLSFLVQLKPRDELVITVSGGRYEYRRFSPDAVRFDDDTCPERDVELWQRHQVRVTARIGCSVFPDAGVATVPAQFPHPLQMEIQITVRPWRKGQHLLTVTLVNRAKRAMNDQCCLFQIGLQCEVHRDGNPVPAILPYPEQGGRSIVDEDAAVRLWYRNVPRFATGHGCAADWGPTKDGRVTRVFCEPLPVYRLPEVSPDIPGHAPQMQELADDKWREPLRSLVDAYERHLDGLSIEAVDSRYREAAAEQVQAAHGCLERMRAGLQCLDTNAVALRAFQLANQAMRLQQIAWRSKTRFAEQPNGARTHSFDSAYRSPTQGPTDGQEPAWRAFQIAFILMNLPDITCPDENNHDRMVVDLIWFPTGGGKTEAYLGLAAFAMLYERLITRDWRPHVQVLMRYTMRLLTAQQFQRTAGLICALEYLRNNVERGLGKAKFRVGVWVGSAMTPNKRKDASNVVDSMEKGQSPEATLFVHNRCPWCAAEVGRVMRTGSTGRIILGVQSDNSDATLRCSDRDCPFYSSGLPLDVVDEHIILNRPSLIIATVDKFAQLPKKPELRALFGIGNDGHRDAPPPNLVIQDELHLITDALGSMVGAFEPLLHGLCAYDDGTPPKIVCSTATVRTYKSQVRSLFGRDKVALFPPPELAPGSSFFAPYRRDQSNKVLRGKAYVGVFGSGFPSFQTSESRTMAALLQAPLALPDDLDESDRRDPYWTLVGFFSSIRELAVTHTLARTQIAEALKSIQWWRDLSFGSGDVRSRYLNVRELTARRKGSDLSRAFAELELHRATGNAMDLCLATSIVEVGIDVGRLSLMCIVGQPKQFSTFIQATGRVGRRHPGVVVTLYDHTRARDRSIYEHFRSVHERLHASVEPTSLTPFASPVQERAVAAVVAAAARLLSPRDGLAADPRRVAPDALKYIEGRIPDIAAIAVEPEGLCWFIGYLLDWVQRSDPDEVPRLQAMLRRRLKEWREWQRPTWHCWSVQFDPTQHDPMMLDADPMTGERERAIRWYVPNSMRDVDRESQLWIRRDMVPAIPGENDEAFPRQEISVDETR